MVNKISNLNFILNSLNNLYVSIFMKLFCRNNWNAENFWIKNTNVGCILIECEAHFQINVHDSSVGFLQLDSVSSGQRWVKQWQFHAGKLKFFFFYASGGERTKEIFRRQAIISSLAKKQWIVRLGGSWFCFEIRFAKH